MKLLLTTVLTAALTALLAVWLLAPSGNSPTTNESAFDRVIRTQTIRCGYATWPPYMSKDPATGQLSGINYEHMEKIGHELGLQIDWALELDWGGVAEALRTNKIDVMCATVWPDGPRMQQMGLTKPLFFSPIYAYVRTNDTRFDGDFAKLNQPQVKFIGLDGDVTSTMGKKMFPQATMITLPQTATPADIILSLVGNKADAILIDEGFARQYSQSNAGNIRKLAGVPHATIQSEVLPVNRNEPDLLNMLNTAIESLNNDGQLQAITSKYADYYLPAQPTFQH